MTLKTAPPAPRLKSLVEIYTRVAEGEKLAPLHLLNVQHEAEDAQKGSGWPMVEAVIEALPANRRASALYDIWIYGAEAGKPADLLDRAVAAIRPHHDNHGLLTKIAPHYAPPSETPFNTEKLTTLLAAIDLFPLFTRKTSALTLEDMYRHVPEASALIRTWKASLEQPVAQTPSMSLADFKTQVSKLAL